MFKKLSILMNLQLITELMHYFFTVILLYIVTWAIYKTGKGLCFS